MSGNQFADCMEDRQIGEAEELSLFRQNQENE
jgi:hypothetical protein